MTVPLRTKVSLAFGLLALVVAVAVSASTYTLARLYLTDQRETSAVSRAQVDARFVQTPPDEDTTESDRLGTLPSVGDSQKLLRRDAVWYSSGASISPDELPGELLAPVDEGNGARQRFRSGSNLYLAVAVPVTGGAYVEVFPLAELSRSLRLIGWILVASAAVAGTLGAVIGWFASSALLRPLRRLRVVASRMADGDLSARMGPVADSDIAPITEAFDEMAESVEARIARERRFTANVSHELRTPITVALGTAELLEARSAGLPADQARLVELLGQQVARLGRTVIDLLELSATTSAPRLVLDRTDVADLTRDLLEARDLAPELVVGGGSTIVSTDPRRLERILVNLVDNAQTHGQGLRRVTVRGGEDGVSVAFLDDGPGVAAEDRARIFEPFTRGATPGTSGGAGLGLAIVVEQARALGVTVRVEDGEDHGASFVVDVPREVG